MAIKRIFEVLVAILLAFLAFQLLGFLFTALIMVARVFFSVLVFGGVFALIDWALFRRNRITR